MSSTSYTSKPKGQARPFNKKNLIKEAFNKKEPNFTYAGIGSRQTPQNVCDFMTQLAVALEKMGYVLHSGGADGADTAFARKVKSEHKKIYYAIRGEKSPEAQKIALDFHPNPYALKQHKNQRALYLMARNSFQVLGDDLKTPVDFVICWTEDGCESYETRTRDTGGTGQAIELASRHNIPVINLKNYEQNYVDDKSSGVRNFINDVILSL